MNALEAIVALLVERYGSMTSGFQYSDAWVVNFDGVFGMGIDLGIVFIDGGETTVNVAVGSFFFNGKVVDQWLADWGAMVRMMGYFSDHGPELYVNFPIGNVADRESPHFDNVLTGWTEGQYTKMLFHRVEIEAAAVGTTTIPVP